MLNTILSFKSKLSSPPFWKFGWRLTPPAEGGGGGVPTMHLIINLIRITNILSSINGIWGEDDNFETKLKQVNFKSTARKLVVW